MANQVLPVSSTFFHPLWKGELITEMTDLHLVKVAREDLIDQGQMGSDFYIDIDLRSEFDKRGLPQELYKKKVYIKPGEFRYV